MLAFWGLHPLSPFEWDDNVGGNHNHSTLMPPLALSFALSASYKSCEYIPTPILYAIAQDQRMNLVLPTLSSDTVSVIDEVLAALDNVDDGNTNNENSSETCIFCLLFS